MEAWSLFLNILIFIACEESILYTLEKLFWPMFSFLEGCVFEKVNQFV